MSDLNLSCAKDYQMFYDILEYNLKKNVGYDIFNAV